MKITIKYFAFFKEKTGVTHEQMEVSSDTTIDDLLGIIMKKNNIENKENIVLSLNQEYVKNDVKLHDGDELAIMIPPSGG